MATAGRILIIPKGEWSASGTYEMLDLVNYNGTSWLSKKHSQGIAPSEETGEYWFNFLGVTINETPVVNNLTTTTAGYVLDARQGKVLMDAINSANTKVGKVESSVTNLQTSLSGTQTTLATTQSSLASTQTSLNEAKTTLTTLSNSVSALQSNATVTKGTLAVGATSIVLSNSKITTSSVLSIYTSVWGVNPKTVTVASGKVTLTFDAQTVAVEVGVRVDG